MSSDYTYNATLASTELYDVNGNLTMAKGGAHKHPVVCNMMCVMGDVCTTKGGKAHCVKAPAPPSAKGKHFPPPVKGKHMPPPSKGKHMPPPAKGKHTPPPMMEVLPFLFNIQLYLCINFMILILKICSYQTTQGG